MFVKGKCLARKQPLTGPSDTPVSCPSRFCQKKLQSSDDVVLLRWLQKSDKLHHIGIKAGGRRLLHKDFPWVRLRSPNPEVRAPSLCCHAEESAGKGCGKFGDACNFALSPEELEYWGGGAAVAGAAAGPPQDPAHINRRGQLLILGEPGARMTAAARMNVRDEETGEVHGAWGEQGRATVIRYVMGDKWRVDADFVFNSDGHCVRNVLFDRASRGGVWLWKKAEVQPRDQSADSDRSGVLVIQGEPGAMPMETSTAYVEDSVTQERLNFSEEHGRTIRYVLGNTKYVKLLRQISVLPQRSCLCLGRARRI